MEIYLPRLDGQLREVNVGGSWVAQLVKPPSPDFCSGHDLEVREIKPRVGLCADSVELLGILSLPLSLSLPPLMLSLSLCLSKSINKLKKKRERGQCKLGRIPKGCLLLQLRILDFYGGLMYWLKDRLH